jgi:rSAM/selenodomain-associated transferase 1
VRVLGVFGRAPVAGQVKSRLASALGGERACALYRAFLDDTLRAAAAAARLGGAELVLAIAGAIDHPDVVALAARHGAQVIAQSDGELGTKLSAFFNTFAGPTVVIGSDSPQLTGAEIARGFDALRSHEAVIGPARDGGYWLIGARRPIPELLLSVPWSTDRVLEVTLDRLAGRSAALLAMSFDVDDLDDLALLRRWLAVVDAEIAPATRAALAIG